MPAVTARRWRCLALVALQLCLLLPSLPVKAASALAAWALTENGTLQLRTSRNATLQAFFQGASDGRGTRVWIDFPGELRFPRRLMGRGAVKEIRLGKPRAGATRLVVEFRPGVKLDPNQLKLRGTAPDRWEMTLPVCRPRGWMIWVKVTSRDEPRPGFRRVASFQVALRWIHPGCPL